MYKTTITRDQVRIALVLVTGPGLRDDKVVQSAKATGQGRTWVRTWLLKGHISFL